MVESVGAFFGTDRLTWTIATSQAAVPRVVLTQRRYHRLSAVLREIDSARVWTGSRWRPPKPTASEIGRRVAAHIVGNFFRPAVTPAATT